jgi:RNA polymerase sigma-70 factor (ECF subfamily)
LIAVTGGPSDADAVLAARLAAGDEGALGTLYDRYGSLVFSLAARITGSRDGAEDVTQEAFVTVWSSIDRFEPQRGSLRSFLYTIAHRRAVDWVRREEGAVRRARLSPALQVDEADPADASAAGDLARQARRALADLPPEQRQTVELVYYDGLSYREVAARLGIPEGTAKSRMRLALAKLAATLDEGPAG